MIFWINWGYVIALAAIAVACILVWMLYQVLDRIADLLEHYCRTQDEFNAVLLEHNNLVSDEIHLLRGEPAADREPYELQRRICRRDESRS